MRQVFAIFVLSIGFAGFTSNVVNADQTTPQTQTISLQSTDWTSSLVFNKFDTSLGVLTGVEFTLNGHIQGSAGYENTGTSAAAVTTKLQAQISVGSPGAATIATAQLVAAHDDIATSFDGTTDFGGTSGKTYSSLTADKSTSITLTDPTSLATFVGTGSISLPVVATGLSSASGSGNLLTKFVSQASASGTLIYIYTPVNPPAGQTVGPGQPQTVPEPSSVALLVCGGLGLFATLRRNSRKRNHENV